MLKCCSLYSGSSGNSFFVQSKTTNILIDAGVSLKKIELALSSIGVNLSDISAILVTHEHIDHTKSLNLLSSKYNIPVFATYGTWCAIEDNTKKIDENNKKTFKYDEELIIGNLKILPFTTPHDAAEPCGFNICNGSTKISIATDLGHIDENLINYLKNSSFLMLESNYEPDILKISSYPYALKHRITGPKGHLSNSDAGNVISKLISLGLKDVLLIHLSKENNIPEIAYETVLEKLRASNYNENIINLQIAPRNSPSQMFNII